MTANYLMYTASVLYFLCYIPELYANYKNKNANIYNLPEKIIMLVATLLAFSYALVNENTELTANYGPLLMFDVIALSMRVYYTRAKQVTAENPLPASIETNISKEVDNLV